jgi:yecA family protein
MPDETARKSDRTPPEATAWCEGYMAGVKLRDDEWQPLYDTQDARDWIFPIEALAFGDRDDDFTEWVDSDEKREGLIDELPVASVLIYRFWHDRRATKDRGTGARRGALPDAARKSRQRLH